MITSPATLTVPCAGLVAARLVCTPVTLALRSIACAVLYATLAVFAAATGAAGAATVTVTVAAFDVPPTLLAVKVKLSLPAKLAAGV